MPRYSAEQIYGFARQGGFSPDEAATMTAIALAESGGNSRAHNPVGENSRGLWQINAKAHPGLARTYDLFDPVQNARAAHEVSRGGADVSPWTVTHGGSSARYLHFRADAQAAAVAYGDHGAVGVWTGTKGYHHQLSPDGGAPAGGGADRFIEAARAQVGDRYVWGAEAKLSNPDPKRFDCSELTQWAAHRAGTTIPDGAVAQYRALRARGLLIPVEEAKTIPGALLFHFDHEPGPGTGAVSGAHVAISTGDGRTIEAMNRRRGVVEAEAGNRFTYAALVPGISDGTATPPPPDAGAGAPATPPPVGGPDTDHDGLTDANEGVLGLNALVADTDGDTLTDGAELVTTHTDPRYADTDGDHLSDSFELAHGLDPSSADADADGHLDGSFADTQVDTDQDGLDDELEEALNLNPQLSDTDADGFTDGLEVRAHSDPLAAASTPLPPPVEVPPPIRHSVASIDPL